MSIPVNEYRTCLAWGCNMTGQLGYVPSDRTITFKSEPIIMHISISDKVLNITCGPRYTIVQTSNEFIVYGIVLYKPVKLDFPLHHFNKTQHIPTWKKILHKFCSYSTYVIVKTVLMLSQYVNDKPRHPNTFFHILPKDVLYYICEYLPLY